MSLIRLTALLLVSLLVPAPAPAKWKYFRFGNAADSSAVPRSGLALMGGGEQPAAFLYLCERANHGDFLILRANTEDDYAQKVNKETSQICPLNSVSTIVFSEREDSDNPQLLQIFSGPRPFSLPAAISPTTCASGRTLRCRRP